MIYYQRKKRSAGAFCNVVFRSQFLQSTSLTPSSNYVSAVIIKEKMTQKPFVAQKNNLHVTLQMEQLTFASILIKNWWIHFSRTFRLDSCKLDMKRQTHTNECTISGHDAEGGMLLVITKYGFPKRLDAVHCFIVHWFLINTWMFVIYNLYREMNQKEHQIQCVSLS